MQTPSHTIVGSHLLVPVLSLSRSPLPFASSSLGSPVHCPPPPPPSPLLPVALSSLVGCLQPHAHSRQAIALTANPSISKHSHTHTRACNVQRVADTSKTGRCKSSPRFAYLCLWRVPFQYSLSSSRVLHQPTRHAGLQTSSSRRPTCANDRDGAQKGSRKVSSGLATHQVAS